MKGLIEISLSDKQIKKIIDEKIIEFVYPIEEGKRKNSLVRIKIGKEKSLEKEQFKITQPEDCYSCLWNKNKHKPYKEFKCVLSSLAKRDKKGNCSRFKKVRKK